MDLISRADFHLQVQHRHDDGSWATLEERPEPHSSADLDPEREWADGVTYGCTRCDELVRVRQEPQPLLR